MMRVLTRMLAGMALVAATFATAGAATAAPAGSGDEGVTPKAGCDATKEATVTGGNDTIVRGTATWTVICSPGHIGASGWVSDHLKDGYDICVKTGSGKRIARTHHAGDTAEFSFREADNDKQLNMFAHAC